MISKMTSRRRNRRGFTLLMVLILVVMLSVLVIGMMGSVVREVSITANVRDDLRAAYLAEMALVRAQVILRVDDHADYDSLNEAWSEPLKWDGETWGSLQGGEGAGGERPPEPTVLIVDEDRKFNLLTLVRGTEEQQTRAREVLKRLIDICQRNDKRLQGWLDGNVRSVRQLGDDTPNTDTLVRNLVRYLEERVSEDSDDLEFTALPEGETGDIRGMKKQTPWEMLTLGELLQVEGWSDKLLYGAPRVQDQQLDPETGEEEDPQYRAWYELTDEERFEQERTAIEQADQRSFDPAPIGLKHYLTLYSGGLININTAPRELLLALDPDLTWEIVDQIITAREQGRVDVRNEELTGEIPEYNTPASTAPPPATGEGEGEAAGTDDDQASFRAADIANYAAFVQRVKNQQTEGDQGVEAFEEFSEEMFNRIRTWFTVRSTVYSVEASAKVGKVTHSIAAVYRRTGTTQPPATNPGGTNPPPANAGENPPPAANPNAQPAEESTGTTAEGTPLPAEPQMKLTLLFRKVSIK